MFQQAGNQNPEYFSQDRRKILLTCRRVREQERDAAYAKRYLANKLVQETIFAKTLKFFLRCVGLLKRGYKNAQTPFLHTIRMEIPQIPWLFDNYRILHVSDLHFSVQLGLTPATLDILRGIQADLCVITGDLLWGKTGPCEPVFENMGKFVEAVKCPDGIFMVLGNHDRISFIEPLKQLGIRVLINESYPIRRGQEAIWLVGVDDPTFFRTHDLELAFQFVPPESFSIFLAHSPELAKQAAEMGANLYLCGHTHGGQICFPWLGSLYYNCRAPKKFCRGSWVCNHMKGYTTSGLGSTELPVRFNCPPEIVLIILKRDSASDSY